MLGRTQCKTIVWERDTVCGTTASHRFLGIAVALLACLASYAVSPHVASAGTSYVDGVSDQSETTWSSSFGAFFKEVWVNNGHIKYSRMVAQWNSLPPFEAWVNDAGGKGLGLDLALTVYKEGEKPPKSIAEYQGALEGMLTRAYELGHPIIYVEPWNEPNGQGILNKPAEGLGAQLAAEYDNTAYKVCETDREKGYGCTIIAGNMQDGSGMEKYEEEYEKYLKPTPKIWGVHPYKTIEERKSNKSETRMQKFVEYLPKKGEGDELIISEVGAFYCKPSGEVVGEETQAKEAEYLTNKMMPWFSPLHVFYYEFDFKEDLPPPCGGGNGEDVALFAPETNEPGFYPRQAAGGNFSGKRSPWALTNPLGGLGKRSAEMRGGIYTSGLSTEYWFEYGTTQSYGSSTGKVGVGSGSGVQWAYGSVESLTPDTTYHYRVVAHNSEATNY